MKNWKFIKPEVFTTNTTNSVDINKLILKRLGDLGITTVNVCCSDGTETIDEKIAAIVTDVTALETQSGEFTEYYVLVSQTSTDAPTAKVLNNTLGGTPTFGYTSAGLFTLTNTGKFTADKTSVQLTASVADTSVYAVRTSADVITFGSSVANTGVATNAKLVDSTFIVRVYA